jgi:hypothetical protein
MGCSGPFPISLLLIDLFPALLLTLLLIGGQRCTKDMTVLLKGLKDT